MNKIFIKFKVGEIETDKEVFLTKDQYTRLKVLSSIQDQDKLIKAYENLQVIIGEQPLLVSNKQLDPTKFTFEIYRDRVLGLFDTIQGDLPNKVDKLLKGYQKSYHL